MKTFKKVIAVFLFFSFLFSFSACKDKPTEEKAVKNTKTTTSAGKIAETEDLADAREKLREKKTEKSTEEEKNTEKTAETQDSTQVTEKTAEKSNTQNTANATKSAKTGTNDSGKDSHGHPWCPHGQCPEICETCNPPTPQRDYGEAATLLSLINSYRASLGLSQFKVEGFMQEYSMQRAYELINDYSHNGNSFQRALIGCPMGKTDSGEDYYMYMCNGECVYMNKEMRAAAALEGFKASPGHNAILTHPESTHCGVGVVTVKQDGRTTYYYAVHPYQAMPKP